MSETLKQKADRKRRERNAEIADDLRTGDYQGAAFDQQASFFPPRGIIEKDPEAIKRLYGDKEHD